MEKLPSTSIRTATMFVDESGSKSSAGKFFVLGLAKTYLPGKLSWQLRNVKERHRFSSELKFSKVKLDVLPVYMDSIEAAHNAGTLFAAFVLDSRDSDQFGSNRSVWKAQADLATQLVMGNLKHDELLTLAMDIVTTPYGISISETVKRQVNQRIGGLAVVNGLDLDSRTCAEIQLADLFAGAVNFERKARAGLTTARLDGKSPKAKLVRHIQEVYEIPSFDDVRTKLVNIKTARTSIQSNSVRK